MQITGSRSNTNEIVLFVLRDNHQSTVTQSTETRVDVLEVHHLDATSCDPENDSRFDQSFLQWSRESIDASQGALQCISTSKSA